MAKLLCSVKSGPSTPTGTTYFNKPVNLAFVRSVAVGVNDNDTRYYIDFEGIDVRWLFDSVEEMESVYEHIISHEF